MDWSNMKPFVFGLQNYNNRKLQEAIEILLNQDSCNKDIGLHIPELYKPFI